MKKILTIVGARPQFIKAAVVSRELKNSSEYKEYFVHTGQHFDKNMSEVFFKEMEIPEPDVNLGIHSGSEALMLGQMVVELEKVIVSVNPDMIIIYGDTTSTLAAAVAAKKCNVLLAHVEAGMRSFNRSMPEEINRILSDHASDLLLCPTKTAVENLRNEGIHEPQDVVLTGDVMYDAFLYYHLKGKGSQVSKSKKIISGNNYALLTLHRQSNVDDPKRLAQLMSALEKMTKNTRLVFPCHPRTKKNLEQLNVNTKKIEIIEPVGYFDMLNLLMNSKIVLTDSGGLQKEAYFAKKYCITLRDETEWVELVEGGYNFLAGDRLEELPNMYEELAHRPWMETENLYGKGEAGKRIVKEIATYLNSF